MVDLICPECTKSFVVPSLTQISDGDGCTLDCPNCDALLVIEGGEVKNFHVYLNSQDPIWPADGNGTGFVEVGQDDN